jgi:ESCRT-II complex subunit VPS22
MRRGVGIGAINKKAAQQTKFAETAAKISDDQMEQMTKQLESFKKNLEDFAFKYKNEIRNNPKFRKQFQDMCANIGVDPLASSKGFWSELLGVGDFYYELAVQIIEICNMYQERTGGLLYLDFILTRLKKIRSKHSQDFSMDDCIRAVKKLHIFGNSFTLIQMKNNRFLLQSVPDELNTDHTQLIQLAESTNAYLTAKQIQESVGWEAFRIENVINFMVKEGIVWIDEHDRAIKYYFPSLFMSSL